MFTPHTKHDVEVMLNSIGVGKIEDLFQEIPEQFRYPDLNLAPRLTEMETAGQLESIAAANATTKDLLSFLGAGAYDHYIPAAVDNLLQRGEFYTAYTPYQPEISQGTLQAIFEFQTLICKLTGMDVSNASHYDGATAAAEAVILAYGNFRNKRKKVLVSRAVNPQYRQVIRTYMQADSSLKIVGDEIETGIAPDMQKFIDQIDHDTALVIVQYPDFFGRIIDYTQLIETAHQFGALVAVAVNPTALGMLTPPGDIGADIAFGEGQPLGIPLSYGGPYLGFFAVKNALLRKLAGRLVGETTDVEGKLAYVLTLTAREQHIRREKASSNICSNQGLMTLAATIYMSLLGKHGLQQVANLCYQKAHYTADQLSGISGFSLVDETTPFFHEFVVKCDEPVEEVLEHLLQHNILGGYNLGHDYPELENHLMLAVTEKISREDIEYLSAVLQEENHG
ncbi:MAG: aminomethyl-transferring glycine dehydrogenase subunit GcvPA [Anaerolineaceae bacterium]|nr:aminomethyl-transferring glycine dehydrogenase subunit GcvPA [Anaerolineaceae bacterium]MDD4043356.1 aminomethyl-transferring glycine dehydrogenase subunit GcvPA [Anaerolineaceae bacterium]MDD4578769.1 aminomethyl-transferring glycine dehydrogenase subunit GcvPA [Anaerolineaceae bacterium]